MNIRVDLNYAIKDGMDLVFRSPVDCSQITGLIVYYKENGNTYSKEFAFADAHGNNVGDIDHLFAENAVVKVILDMATSMAFVQNADTNAYLEQRFDDIEESLSPIVCNVSGEVVAVSDASDKKLRGLTVYGKSVQSGTPTPDAPVPIVSAGGESGGINVLLRDKLLIAQHPKDVSVALGAVAVFTVKAVGKGLTYQWQYFSIYDNAKWVNTTLDGCTTSALRVTATVARSGNQYRCVITDAHGNTLTSKPAFLTIGSTEAITILDQPKDAVIGIDATAILTVDAIDTEGFANSYQWQYQLPTEPGWFNTSMTGANTNELRVPAQGNGYIRFGYQYRCIITDGNGNVFCTRSVTLYNSETFTDADDFPEDAQVLTISTPNGLPGLPVSSGGNYTDENGQRWLCDTLTEQKLLRGIFDGSSDESWGHRSTQSEHLFALASPFGARYAGMAALPAISNYGYMGTVRAAANVTSEGCWIYWNPTTASGDTIYVYDSSCSTLEDFKAKLAAQPLEIIAQAAEPIAKELDAETAAAIAALRTYKPNTTIVNDAGAGMAVEYVADTKAYIDNKFTELQNAIVATGAYV